MGAPKTNYWIGTLSVQIAGLKEEITELRQRIAALEGKKPLIENITGGGGYFAPLPEVPDPKIVPGSAAPVFSLTTAGTPLFKL